MSNKPATAVSKTLTDFLFFVSDCEFRVRRSNRLGRIGLRLTLI